MCHHNIHVQYVWHACTKCPSSMHNNILCPAYIHSSYTYSQYAYAQYVHHSCTTCLTLIYIVCSAVWDVYAATGSQIWPQICISVGTYCSPIHV